MYLVSDFQLSHRMSPFPILGHEYIVLHSIIERTSHSRDTHAIVISKSEPIAITQTYEAALDVLEYHRKKIASRKNTAEVSLCMCIDTIDGVDIARLPSGRAVVEEVRLRIMGADVWGEKEGHNAATEVASEGNGKSVRAEDPENGNSSVGGTRTVALHAQGRRDVATEKGHGEGQTVRDSDGCDGRPESRTPTPDGQGNGGLGESKDHKGEAADNENVQSDISELRTPHAEGQPYDFGNTRLRLRNVVPKWSVGGTEGNPGQPLNQPPQAQVYAGTRLHTNGRPILPNGLRASSIDGCAWTVKYEERISDTAYERWMAKRT